MANIRVRVRVFEQPIEVDEDEMKSLRAQGLLIEDPVAELRHARDRVAAELERLDAELTAARAENASAASTAPARKPTAKES